MAKKRLKYRGSNTTSKQADPTWDTQESLKLFFWLGLLIIILSLVVFSGKTFWYGAFLGMLLSITGVIGLILKAKCAKKGKNELVVKRISVHSNIPVEKTISLANKKPKKILYFNFIKNLKNLFRIKEKAEKRLKKAEKAKPSKSVVNAIKSMLGTKKQHETEFDVLVNVVNKYSAVSLSEVSEGFSINMERAEEWGKILAEHELVEMQYPTFGEPIIIKVGAKEIREVEAVKPKNLELNFTKKIIVIAVALMLLLILVFAFRAYYKPEKALKEKIKVGGLGLDIVKAFSGNGSFRCSLETDNKNITYYIKDADMKMIIGNGINSTSIFKGGKLYSYAKSRDAWIRTDVPSNIATPGSGNVPSINMACKEEQIKEKEFDVPLEKVI